MKSARRDEVAVVVGRSPPAGLDRAIVEQRLVDAEFSRLGRTPRQHALAANPIADLRLVFDDQDMRPALARAMARLEPASPPPTMTRSQSIGLLPIQAAERAYFF